MYPYLTKVAEVIGEPVLPISIARDVAASFGYDVTPDHFRRVASREGYLVNMREHSGEFSPPGNMRYGMVLSSLKNFLQQKGIYLIGKDGTGVHNWQEGTGFVTDETIGMRLSSMYPNHAVAMYTGSIMNSDPRYDKAVHRLLGYGFDYLWELEQYRQFLQPFHRFAHLLERGGAGSDWANKVRAASCAGLEHMLSRDPVRAWVGTQKLLQFMDREFGGDPVADGLIPMLQMFSNNFMEQIAKEDQTD